MAFYAISRVIKFLSAIAIPAIWIMNTNGNVQIDDSLPVVIFN